MNSPRHKADALDHIIHVPFFVDIRDVKNFVDAFFRPFRIFQTLRCQQNNTSALAFCFLQKIEAFVVAGDAEEGEH